MKSLASPSGLARKLVATSWVQPEALNVTPDLVGVPLAPHARRVWAMLVDLAAIALLSSTGSFWVAVAAAGLVFQWRRRQHERSAWRNFWLWTAIALLVFVSVQRAANVVGKWMAPQAAAAALAAEKDDDDSDADTSDIEKARDVLGDKTGAALLRSGPAASAASGVVAPELPVVAAATVQEVQLAARVKQLEGELAEARKPRPARWRDDVVKAAHRIGLGFGWAIAYFTLLPFWWKGQTVGKKLFGLRVVQLTGAPLSVITCFGRYGGYAAGMATGASGFLQVLWDSNRQAIQDKIAHTVVVDLREARAVVVLDTQTALAANATPAAESAAIAGPRGDAR